MFAAQAGSLLNSSNPSLALSSRPTGASHGNEAPAKQRYTVSRPCSSLALVTRPRGLLSISTSRLEAAGSRPSISMRSRPWRTGYSGSRTKRPLTRTRASPTMRAACVREASPSLEITRATPKRAGAGPRVRGLLRMATFGLGGFERSSAPVRGGPGHDRPGRDRPARRFGVRARMPNDSRDHFVQMAQRQFRDLPVEIAVAVDQRLSERG